MQRRTLLNLSLTALTALCAAGTAPSAMAQDSWPNIHWGRKVGYGITTIIMVTSSTTR